MPRNAVEEGRDAVRRVALGQFGGDREGEHAGVDVTVGRLAHVLDRHTVDRVDLVDHQIDQRTVGQRDDELVDHAASADLEDLDREDVAPHRTDPARHLPECSGAVGQPDADDDGVHGIEARHRV